MQNTSLFQVYHASAGSGKTFTLVKEYLKIVLRTNDSLQFKQILAITFTNKAAGEMKSRILDNLNEFSQGKENDMAKSISNEISIPFQKIEQRASCVLEAIMQNYTAFNITTIDSFTYKIIKTFAFDLGMTANFEVEMDAVKLIQEAVDLLISKIGTDKELTTLLVNFAIDKANDDKSWNIEADLNESAKVLLDENNAFQLQKIQQKSIKDFVGLKRILMKERKVLHQRLIDIGEQGIELIENQNLEVKDFYRSQIPTHFFKLAQGVDKLTNDTISSLQRNIEQGVYYAKSKSQNIKNTIDNLILELTELISNSVLIYKQLQLDNLLLKSIVPLAVLNAINKILEEIKQEKNIRLNAEFNKVVSDKIKGEPAPFIYERIGEKFKHYFIDEMQDTSVLQWQNLIPLIDNALSQEQTSLLLVGDAKQAIYRWRGGKPEQFIDLSLEKESNPFQIKKTLSNLDTNYRSYSEIIKFNNGFFTHIAKVLKKPIYQELYKMGNQQNINSKIGGYVNLSFIEKGLVGDEKEMTFTQRVYEIIQDLKGTYRKNEICVLVRTKKQGVAVATYLTEMGIDIISSETLLLKNNPKVNFIINLLTVIQEPLDKEVKINILYFLHKHLSVLEDKHSFFSRFIHLSNFKFFKKLEEFNIKFDITKFKSLSFYSKIEEIIRAFYLTKTSDAYLQFFLDEILDFSQQRLEGVVAFLEYWEQKKEKLSIVVPESKDAVRIMTIHKAKGLEFQVVIFPFDVDIIKQLKPKIWYEPLNKEVYNGFDSLLINFNKSLEVFGEKGQKLYDERIDEVSLDKINLLYVALTRAVEQLYIVSETKEIKNNINNFSQLFIDYLQAKGKWNGEVSCYEFGDKKRKSSLPQLRENNIEQELFISSPRQNHNISIVANSALLWDTEQGEAIKYGNLIHELFASIKLESDLEVAKEQLALNGLLDAKEQEKIIGLLKQVVSHPKLNKYFKSNLTIYTEKEIITENKEVYRLDRLVIDKNMKATIIDYKTGNQKEADIEQINNYEMAIKKMDYTVEKKLLVYLSPTIFVKEVKL